MCLLFTTSTKSVVSAREASRHKVGTQDKDSVYPVLLFEHCSFTFTDHPPLPPGFSYDDAVHLHFSFCFSYVGMFYWL